jgi:DEAD/DEAH box helicase domain-containing protein
MPKFFINISKHVESGDFVKIKIGIWLQYPIIEFFDIEPHNKVSRLKFFYQESTALQLVEKLQPAVLVVGFNVKKFDYGVLQPYADFDLDEITTFDMLTDINKKLGHRLSLNHLAENTLNSKKSADGLVSLQWYKEGKIDKVIEYCKQDVEITRDLFLYGESYGYIKYCTRSGVVKDLEVDWKMANLINPP